METNSKKVLEALPDFQDFMNLAEEIKELYVARMRLENQIKLSESLTFKEVMNNERFFINGKPVPVSYYENRFKHSGIDGETLELRNQLAEIVAGLELKRSQFEIYQRMLEMHKTLVYQEKAFA